MYQAHTVSGERSHPLRLGAPKMSVNCTYGTVKINVNVAGSAMEHGKGNPSPTTGQ
jgi:hypothetical protein